MRPKDSSGLMGEYNAFFYKFISKNTDEEKYMEERQKVLIN